MASTPEQKQYFEPIKILTPKGGTNPQAEALKRSPEERKYIILYYNTEYEEDRYEVFHGRFECYRGIERVLNGENIDIRNSKVLVESVVLDYQTGAAKRAMTHPDDASNFIAFCKQVEGFFPEEARFDVSEFDNGDLIYGEEEETPPPPQNYNPFAHMFGGDTVPASTFMSAEEAKALNERGAFNPVIFDDNVERKEI